MSGTATEEERAWGLRRIRVLEEGRSHAERWAVSERRWTDADLKAAWEDGVMDGAKRDRFVGFEANWEKSRTRARIRALEIARAGLHGGRE